MNFPRLFSISAAQTDYSLGARDLAFRVPVRYRINVRLDIGGRKLLTGWKDSAAVPVVFVVRHPANEVVARQAVQAALHELAMTLGVFRRDLPEADECTALAPLIRDIPLGAKFGDIKLVPVPKGFLRRAAIVHDWTLEVRLAWGRQLAGVKQLVGWAA
jgi:hypothetical protein